TRSRSELPTVRAKGHALYWPLVPGPAPHDLSRLGCKKDEVHPFPDGELPTVRMISQTLDDVSTQVEIHQPGHAQSSQESPLPIPESARTLLQPLPSPGDIIGQPCLPRQRNALEVEALLGVSKRAGLGVGPLLLGKPRGIRVLAGHLLRIRAVRCLLPSG